MNRFNDKNILAKCNRSRSSITFTGSHMNRRSFDPDDDGVSVQSSLLAGHVSFDESDEDTNNNGALCEDDDDVASRTRDSSLAWQVETENPLNLNIDALPDNELSLVGEEDTDRPKTPAVLPSRWREMGKENIPPSPKALAAPRARIDTTSHLGSDHLILHQGWNSSESRISSSSHLADSGFAAEENKTGVMLAKQLQTLEQHLRKPLATLHPNRACKLAQSSEPSSHTNSPVSSCGGRKRKLDDSSEVSSTTQPARKRRASPEGSLQARPALKFVSRIPVSIERLKRKRQASVEEQQQSQSHRELAPAAKRPREAPKAPQRRPPVITIAPLRDVDSTSSRERVKPVAGGAGCTPYHRRPVQNNKRLPHAETRVPSLLAPAACKLQVENSKNQIVKRPGTPYVKSYITLRTKPRNNNNVGKNRDAGDDKENVEPELLKPPRLVVPRVEQTTTSIGRRSNEVTRMARKFESLVDAQRQRPAAAVNKSGAVSRIPHQPGSTSLVQRAKSALTENLNRPPLIRARSPLCSKIGKLAPKREAAIAALRPQLHNASSRTGQKISPRFAISPVRPSSKPVRELRKMYSPSFRPARPSPGNLKRSMAK